MFKAFLFSLVLTFSINTKADSIGNIPERGELKSEVKIEIFADFQCPYTKRAVENLNVMLQDIRNDFSVSFRHFPLSFHDHAQYAHKTAICAQDQGKFWEMHDELFKLASDKFNAANIDKLVKKLELNESSLKKCMDSKEAEKIITRDLKLGESLKVMGTPNMIITGPKGKKTLNGAYPIEDIKKAIQEVLY